MTHRQNYQCWQCQEQYSLLLPEEDVASFIVVCPYCGAEATIELADYPKKRDIYRAGDDATHVSGVYDLPELIVTCPNTTRHDEDAQ